MKSFKYFLFSILFLIMIGVMDSMYDTNVIHTKSIEYYASSKLTINKTPSDKISFEKSSYRCNKGKVIDTIITSSNTSVASFKSSNTRIASVGKNPDYAVKCINCLAVRIYCNDIGNVTLSASSRGGATTSSQVIVEEKENNISFDKKNYSCEVGKTIDTVIRTNSQSIVSSFKSNNTTVASIEKNPDYAIKCINCLAVRIRCKNSGKATLTAKSSNGSSTTSSVSVKSSSNSSNSSISFDKANYYCSVGQKIDAVIKTTYPDSILSYMSYNSRIASIEKNPSYNIKCIDCLAVRITCKEKGHTFLLGKSTSGFSAYARVNIS